jgi:hypothetical protein
MHGCWYPGNVGRENMMNGEKLMPELELTANNPTFQPVPLDASDPLPDPELRRRVQAAENVEGERQWNLKNSENHLAWSRDTYKVEMRNARRNAIQAWNAEQLAKANP